MDHKELNWDEDAGKREQEGPGNSPSMFPRCFHVAAQVSTTSSNKDESRF